MTRDRGAGAWKNRGMRGTGGKRRKGGKQVPKLVGTGRKRDISCNIVLHFTVEIEQRGGNPYDWGGKWD